ncbi:MAG: TPM domain-containing protein [Clostridia bacterium]|nr:TPM domain-containing protein [Clostridia bacterium]
MKRFISFIACIAVMYVLTITVFGASEEETIPIPEMPEDIYIIDEPGALTKRASMNIVRKGNQLFAITGAQVVMVIVDENNDIELGLLAKQILERWEIGSHERDNGFVIVIDFNRGRASYAVGEGLSELFTTSEVTKLITAHDIGNGFADGNYVMVASALYNDIEKSIYNYYGTYIDSWDGKTYHFKAGYEVEDSNGDMLKAGISALGLVLFFALVIVSSIRHNKKMSRIRGYEKEGGYSDEEEETAENADEPKDSFEEQEAQEEYVTDVGEYNTNEGEYNTEVDAESYNSSEEWKYN